MLLNKVLFCSFLFYYVVVFQADLLFVRKVKCLLIHWDMAYNRLWPTHKRYAIIINDQNDFGLRMVGYLYLSLYIIRLTKTVASVIMLYSWLLHNMIKYSLT